MDWGNDGDLSELILCIQCLRESSVGDSCDRTIEWERVSTAKPLTNGHALSELLECLAWMGHGLRGVVVPETEPIRE